MQNVGLIFVPAAASLRGSIFDADPQGITQPPLQLTTSLRIYLQQCFTFAKAITEVIASTFETHKIDKSSKLCRLN